MGYMVDGEWRTDIDHQDGLEDGGDEYIREETYFRDWIDPGTHHPPDINRYHLYVSYACPWAHRTLLTRTLLGLEEVVSVDVVDPIRFSDGWEFSPEKDGCTRDTINGFDYLREVYHEADPSYTGRVTVPVLWDKQEGTIVNNESEEIIKMFAATLRDLGTQPIDLYPKEQRTDIDAVIDDVYDAINNGVYRAGFATSQSAYETAVTEVFEGLDKYERVLSDQRYLTGEALTLADICMFPTLYRFDEVYHTHFKCNQRRITDHPSIWGYLRELYQLPGVSATCNMGHIKRHYYQTHLSLNPNQIVPVGPNPDFEVPHNRDQLSGGPPSSLLVKAD